MRDLNHGQNLEEFLGYQAGQHRVSKYPKLEQTNDIMKHKFIWKAKKEDPREAK